MYEVTPISTAEHQDLLLVCFTAEINANPSLPLSDAAGSNWGMQQLVQELNATREDFQRTIEQSRISGEEMTAANEEIMAMNEELQSANEELESSKEELQSLNDELVTSNTRLDARVAEAIELNIDLSNLINSAETATVLLDETLHIRRYTPACTQLMRVIPGDIGRALDDVVHLFSDSELSGDCMKVMRGEVIPDHEIRVGDDHFYLRRILPYRGMGGQIIGVVLTFPDITSVKQSNKLLHERAQQLQWQSNLLRSAAPIIGCDLQSQIIYWNQGAEELYGWTESEALGKITHELLQTRFPAPPTEISAELMKNSVWEGELTHVTRNGTSVIVISTWTLYRNEAGDAEAIVEVNNNISKRKQALAELRASETKFHTMLDCAYDWEYWIGTDDRFVYMTPSVERLTGYLPEDFERDPALLNSIVFTDDTGIWQRHLQQRLISGTTETGEIQFRIVRKDGKIRWVSHTFRPVIHEAAEMQGWRVTVRDITEQKVAEEQIRELAYFDPLTRLPNRRLMMDRLRRALTSSRRSMQYGVLMILDLDYFKSLNDTQGHDVGDLLLIEVAHRLTACVREEDTVSRLGGDEFVILLENLGSSEHTAANEAESVAEKLRTALNLPYTLNHSEQEYFNTPSIGLTLFGDHDCSPDTLLKQADVALYQAKDAGRNTVRYFNPAMQAAINARIAMEDALRRGLDKHEFRLYYQPQVDQDGRVTGAEALIRWLDPNLGLIPPAMFITLAEETGLILKIGHWVMETACLQLKAWEQDPHCRQMQLAVNVSARQFHQPEFVEQVKQTLQLTGIDPTRLKLELTEGVVLDNIEETISRMHELQKTGISFSMDDFGTGYSSLAYLKRLPLAQVKIDQSFVQDIPDDPNDSAIVQAILAMCKSLDVHVIAEGVETEAQRAFLLKYGCTAYQGYLFGKPMPIEEWQRFCDNP